MHQMVGRRADGGRKPLRVLEFTQNCIRLYSKLGILRIEGRNMDIRLADCESVIIYGEICGLFYENLKNKG